MWSESGACCEDGKRGEEAGAKERQRASPEAEEGAYEEDQQMGLTSLSSVMEGIGSKTA